MNRYPSKRQDRGSKHSEGAAKEVHTFVKEDKPAESKLCAGVLFQQCGGGRRVLRKKVEG